MSSYNNFTRQYIDVQREKEKVYNIEDIQIKKIGDMPIQFDPNKEIRNIIKQKIIRPLIEHKNKKTKIQLLFIFIQQCMFFVIVFKFPTVNKSQIIMKQKCQQVKKYYLLIFMEIAHNKHYISNLIIFLTGLIIYRKLYRVLPKNRSQINERFKIDVCLLLNNLILGVCLSDSFIISNLKKLFIHTQVRQLPQQQQIKKREQQQKNRPKQLLHQDIPKAIPENQEQAVILNQIKNKLQQTIFRKVIQHKPKFDLEPIQRQPQLKKFNVYQISNSLSQNLLYSNNSIPFSKYSPIKYRMEYIPIPKATILNMMQQRQKTQEIRVEEKKANGKKHSNNNNVNYWMKVVEKLKQNSHRQSKKKNNSYDDDSDSSSDSKCINFKFKEVQINKQQKKSRNLLKPIKIKTEKLKKDQKNFNIFIKHNNPVKQTYRQRLGSIIQLDNQQIVLKKSDFSDQKRSQYFRNQEQQFKKSTWINQQKKNMDQIYSSYFPKIEIK